MQLEQFIVTDAMHEINPRRAEMQDRTYYIRFSFAFRPLRRITLIIMAEPPYPFRSGAQKSRNTPIRCISPPALSP